MQLELIELINSHDAELLRLFTKLRDYLVKHYGPDKKDVYLKLRGLCDVISKMHYNDELDSSECFTLNKHIKLKFQTNLYSIYYWPFGEYEPRLNALNSYIQELKENMEARIELAKWQRVNQCKTLEELAVTIESFADSDGLIQGRDRKFDAKLMAGYCRDYDKYPANTLTREYGIRQQGIYLRCS